jgi:hypothetical protein
MGIGCRLRPTDPLPKAETILDRYVQVTGGKEAYEKCRMRVSQGRESELFPFLGPGSSRSVVVCEKQPNYLVKVTEHPSGEKRFVGTDGVAIWTQRHAPELFVPSARDPAKAALVRFAVFDREWNWQKVYKDVETIGIEWVGLRPCYKLRMTPHQGRPDYQGFDTETGLLLRMVPGTSTPLVGLDNHYSEYLWADGLLRAHSLFQFHFCDPIVQMPVWTVFDRIEHNVELPQECLDIPEEWRERP